MAARAVSSFADDKQDDNEDDHRERDEREDLHPTRRSSRLCVVVSHLRQVGVLSGTGGRIRAAGLYQTRCRYKINVYSKRHPV